MKERDLIESVLPIDRAGYKEIRDLIQQMVVLGEGRRGRGNLILGCAGDAPDCESPLSPVVAYGAVETTRDRFTVTVREPSGSQVDVELVSGRGDEIPDHFEEKRRWTYSTWQPGAVSPASGTLPREIAIDDVHTLAISCPERRLWIHDSTTGMVILLPITNYYNELMLHKGIRDPHIALASGLLFDQLDRYTDADLRAAFIAYNAVRKRVLIKPHQEPEPQGKFTTFVRRVFSTRRSHGS